jgi:putative two-component system response regulator
MTTAAFVEGLVPSCGASASPAAPPVLRTRRGASDASTLACKIMIVDDEEFNILVFRRYLRDAGYQHIVHTNDATQALDLVGRERPDVLLLDVMMPGITGLDILAEIGRQPVWDHLPVLILTASQEDAIKQTALELGATDFLGKPITANELIPRVRNALLNKRYKDQLARHADELEQLVRRRTAELEWSRREVVFCLAGAAEFRDTDTGHHVMRVGRYVGVIARRLGFPADEVDVLELAAQLHDIGKIGMPDGILKKPDGLSPEEYAAMQEHCRMGLEIIQPPRRTILSGGVHGDAACEVRSPLLVLAGKIAMSHHERWDGTGYPLKLKGEEIPIEGRMTIVADIFDALSSARPYKEAFSVDRSLRMLEAERGRIFDPRILDVFLGSLDEILAIREELRD